MLFDTSQSKYVISNGLRSEADTGQAAESIAARVLKASARPATLKRRPQRLSQVASGRNAHTPETAETTVM